MSEADDDDEAATDNVADTLPVLDQPCRKCGGRGTYGGGGVRERCGLCDGAGYVPTAFGDRVLALVRHNFRPMYDDMRGD